MAEGYQVYGSTEISDATTKMKEAFESSTSPQAMVFAKFDGIDGDSTKDGFEGCVDVHYYREAHSWPPAVGYTSSQGSGLTGTCKLTPYLLGMQVNAASATLAKKAATGEEIPSVTLTILSGTDTAPLEVLLKPARVVYHNITEPAAGRRALHMVGVIGKTTQWTYKGAKNVVQNQDWSTTK
jgi:type VI protein secretion system component Hcp